MRDAGGKMDSWSSQILVSLNCETPPLSARYYTRVLLYNSFFYPLQENC